MATVYRPDQLSTVTDVTNIKLDISEVIDLLSPTEVPLLDRIGRDSLKFPCTQVKHEWMEDELRPRETTLLTAYTAGSGTLTVASGAGNYFYEDDLLMIGDNILRIISGPPDSDTFIVVGGVGRSTDAAASSGATVTRISSALPEGSVSRVDTTKTKIEMPYNYTQILRDQLVLTGTMEVIERYGYVSERAYQEEKVLRNLAIDLEHLLLYGVRSYSAGPPRHSTLGGLFDHIYLQGVAEGWTTLYKDAGGAYFDEDMMKEMLRNIWEAGGEVNGLVVLVNGFNKETIDSWGKPFIRTERPENTVGNVIGRYQSTYGSVEIMLDRWLRASDVVFLNPSDVGIGPLNGRAFASRRLPQLGDYTQTEILGEYTMEVRRAGFSHAWIVDTATS